MRTPIAVLSATGLLLSAGTAESAKYQCGLNDLVRRVEVVYIEPGSEVPCEVHYYKDTEAPGDSQVLWSAAAQIRYCESKAEEFVEKLRGWGWSCGSDEGSAAGTESDAVMEETAVTEEDLVEPES